MSSAIPTKYHRSQLAFGPLDELSRIRLLGEFLLPLSELYLAVRRRIFSNPERLRWRLLLP